MKLFTLNRFTFTELNGDLKFIRMEMEQQKIIIYLFFWK